MPSPNQSVTVSPATAGSPTTSGADSTGETPATTTRPSVLPSAGAIIQAGAFGAALSAVSTGIADTVRVKAGEITPAEAVQDVAKSSLQGAMTMAVASSVAHMVRARPVIGLAILAVAGIGLFTMMGERKRKPRHAPHA